jgi:AraC-like DNA-binding protein
LIRHTTGARRLPASADGVLPHRKLRTVIEYIMENLEGSPTLEQMAALVHISPYHFARQFKAATGVPPHQYVVARRVERASTSCGETTSSVWRKSRFASASRTKAIFPVTSSGSSASRRDSFGFPQGNVKVLKQNNRLQATVHRECSPTQHTRPGERRRILSLGRSAGRSTSD